MAAAGSRSITVGVRELKTHLSEYLKRVKAGEGVFITERGKVVARLTPEAAEAGAVSTTEDAMLAMVRAGTATWSGRKPDLAPPRVKLKHGEQISDILLRERGER
jgi:prevent-host-death family protein